MFFFFCKQKTAYEMRISDWSADVCSSDLATRFEAGDLERAAVHAAARPGRHVDGAGQLGTEQGRVRVANGDAPRLEVGLDAAAERRSEESRVGKEGGSTCRSRRAPYP